jgi:hypothetical protein
MRARAIADGRPVACEDDEQAAVIEWAQLVRVVVGDRVVPLSDHLYAVPNGATFSFRGTKEQRFARLRRLRRLGFQDGCLDLNLDLARGRFHGARLEMKTHRGLVSPAQHAWIERHTRAGYFATVAFGARQAIDVLSDYLGRQTLSR